MLKELIRWRPFSMSRSQAEYLWLILLASAVGFLAALGNLLLRELIRSFIYVFRVLEWNALRIPSGRSIADRSRRSKNPDARFRRLSCCS